MWLCLHITMAQHLSSQSLPEFAIRIFVIIGKCWTLFTILFKPLFACSTLLARINHTTYTNMITWFEMCDISPDTHHAADNLMARHHWVNAVAIPVIVDFMHVRMTYATVKNLDNYIVSANITTFKLIWH